MAARWGLLAALVCLTPLPAAAGLMVEGEMDGQAMRLVVDPDLNRVAITLDGERHLVDLANGHVYLKEGDKTRRRAVELPYGPSRQPSYAIEDWGRGPLVAGHASTYHVIKVGATVCAEVLASRWMRPFIGGAAKAIAMLEAVKRRPAADPCASVPFATYAALGWPLMAGKRDRPILTTAAIDFSYAPKGSEVRLPTTYTTGARR